MVPNKAFERHKDVSRAVQCVFESFRMECLIKMPIITLAEGHAMDSANLHDPKASQKSFWHMKDYDMQSLHVSLHPSIKH